MKRSIIWGELVRNREVESFNKAKTFESNISNGRKIFRLFLWLNEIEEIHNHVHNTKMNTNIKFLRVISSICSFIYYFTDNIVWLAKIGYVNKMVPLLHLIFGYEIKWGTVKNQFSLGKTLFELVIFIYTYKLKGKEEAELWEKINQFDYQMIRRNKKCFVYIRKMLILRREMRYIRIEIGIYLARLVLLVSGLKLVGNAYLDPIFVSIVGLT